MTPRRGGCVRVFIALPIAAAMILTARPNLAAAQETLACFAPNKGPCAAPEPFALFLPPASEQVVLITNFGLLSSTVPGGPIDLVCDQHYGSASWQRIRFDPAGRIFGASDSGLYLSDDGCSWATAGGDLAGQPVWDVAFDPRTSGRAWALGSSPAILFRSSDGGRTFQTHETFGQGMTFNRVVVAPAGDGRLYLTGQGDGAVSLVSVSLDGGLTWTTRDITQGITPQPRNPLELVAIAPDDPRVLFFSVADPFGDQIWKTDDAGVTVARVLTLGNAEVLSGFTFGASAATVYVAARDLFAGPTDSPARLHISRDGGTTWAPPIASPPGGANYRCLGFRAGRLHACGGGEAFKEPFLLGVSTDDGATWAPVGRLAHFIGGKTCVRAQCAATEEWLCDSFGACPPDVGTKAGQVDAGLAAPDAGSRDACVGPSCGDAGGKRGASCSIDPTTRQVGPGWALAAGLAFLALRRRRDR